MHFRKFQEKLVRRAASPVEIIYAVSSHWFLITLCAVICTFAVLVRVSSETPVYGARATVILESPQSVLQTDVRGREGHDAQARVFHSPAVLEATIKALEYHKIRPSTESETREEESGSLVEFLRQVSEKVEEVWSRTAGIQDSEIVTEADRVNRQVHSFRMRSTVTPIRESNHVMLQVRGANREILERELANWILSYRAVLKKLTDEGISPFLAESVERWQGLADEAKLAIERFKTDHPNANPGMQKYFQEKVIRKQLDIDRLKIQLENVVTSKDSGARVVETQVVQDSLISVLEESLKSLQLERVMLEGNYPEQGKVLDDHDQKIAAMRRRIKELKTGFSRDVSSEEIDVASTLELLKSSIETEMDELENLRRTQAQIENELGELEELTRDYQFKITQRNSYHERTLYTEELQAGRNVMIRVLDPPRADFAPIPANKEIKVAAGAVGGIAFGLLLSFFLELMCRRVRFKKDVVEELGLEVVGVLPLK